MTTRRRYCRPQPIPPLKSCRWIQTLAALRPAPVAHAAAVGINPIATLEKQLLNMIETLLCCTAQ